MFAVVWCRLQCLHCCTCCAARQCAEEAYPPQLIGLVRIRLAPDQPLRHMTLSRGSHQSGGFQTSHWFSAVACMCPEMNWRDNCFPTQNVFLCSVGPLNKLPCTGGCRMLQAALQAVATSMAPSLIDVCRCVCCCVCTCAACRKHMSHRTARAHEQAKVLCYTHEHTSPSPLCASKISRKVHLLCCSCATIADMWRKLCTACTSVQSSCLSLNAPRAVHAQTQECVPSVGCSRP